MNHRTRHRAFTLIELLVVVAIIVALLAILMPSMNRAVAITESVQCMSQMRSLGQATMSLTSDSFGRLPAVMGGQFAGDGPLEFSWLGSEVFSDPHFPPSWGDIKTRRGALFPYLGSSVDTVRELVRCPSLPYIQWHHQQSSNGLFDMTMIQAMAGAKVSNLPTSTEMRNLDTGESEWVITRLFTEEDPAEGINWGNKDPGHMAQNRMGSWHFDDGGNYIGVDGSAHRLAVPEAIQGPRADYFWAAAPSGDVIPVSPRNTTIAQYYEYGWWNLH